MTDAVSSSPSLIETSRAEVPARSLVSRALWAAVVTGACLVAALTVTWPLAANLATDVPMGTEHEATVQLAGLWSLWWTADRAAQGFAGYWDAPIFYPNPGVFTYSEPQPLTGLVVAPLWGLAVPPALIYNLALLAMLALNGIFAYRLARALDAPRLPALMGGLLVVALPFIVKVYGVLALVPAFGILWTLDGLVRFGRDGSTRYAAWAAAGLVVTYVTCQQYMLMFAPFAVVAGLVALAQQEFKVKALLRLGLAGLAAGLAVLVVALPTIARHSELGFTRSNVVVQALSAGIESFLTRPGTAWISFPPQSWNDTAGLFPGMVLVGLACLGIAAAWLESGNRRWANYLGGSTLVAAILAMGLNFQFAVLQPFAILRTVLPGYSELRSPFRFAIIMQLALALLATMGLVYIARSLGRRGAMLVVLLGALAILENLSVPAPLVRLPLSPRTAWTEWLRRQPADTVVAHVPFPAGLSVADYEIDAGRMFAQIDHHKPIVNGYSSYFPPGYTDFQIDMAQHFPRQDLFCQLNKGIGVNMLILDKGWSNSHKAAMDPFKAFLAPAYSDAQVDIYRLQAPEGVCKPNPSSP